MSKRRWKAQIGAYQVEVQDYQYRSRPPVSVRVSGTIDSECRNNVGEPCYFYQSAEAMSLAEGIQKGKSIVAEQQNKAQAGGNEQ